MKSENTLNVAFLDKGSPQEWLVAANTLITNVRDRFGDKASYSLEARREAGAVMFLAHVHEV